MARQRAVLRVEELGQRILPSVSPLDFRQLATTAAHVPHHVAPATQSLTGRGIALYTSSMQIPDTGTSYQLQGVGDFGTLGFATISGQLHSVGFILQGHATGTLTLTNTRGSVTLELTGPAQGGFAALPQQFQYQVVSGTGAYAHFQAQGTLQLQTLAGTGATPGAPGYGVFSLKIS